MIFETLSESSERGELMLLEHGMCHWHLRRDGQLTIREIISQRPGTGRRILERLKRIPGAVSLYAKCPLDLPANMWYYRRGFHVDRMEITKSGRKLNCWKYPIRHEPQRQFDLIYCADGNRRFAEIAIDAGWQYGAQLPNTVYYRPYFVDQNWRAPERSAYMDALAQHRPRMATVLDLETWVQLDEVMRWAEDAAAVADVVIIIPKIQGVIARLPRTVSGKELRLGFSVPTKFAGTRVSLTEFTGWPVHLLGGSPTSQLHIARQLDVRSADCNMVKERANNCQFWTPKQLNARNKHWPTIAEAGGGFVGKDSMYEAFRRSVVNARTAWDTLLAARQIGRSDAIGQPQLFELTG